MTKFGNELELEEIGKGISSLTYEACSRLLVKLYSIIPKEELTRIKISLDDTRLYVEGDTAKGFSRYLTIECYVNKKEVWVAPPVSAKHDNRDKLIRKLRRILPEYEVKFGIPR